MSGWGGESKGERVIEVQNDIGANHLEKTQFCTAMGENSKEKKQSKRVKPLTGD